MAITAIPHAPNHLFTTGMPVFYQSEPGAPTASGTITELRETMTGEEASYTINPADGGAQVVISESQILARRSLPAEIKAAAKASSNLPPLPVTVLWHESNSYRLNLELDVADFMEYVRVQSSNPLERDFDDAIFRDLTMAADMGDLEDEVLLLGFRGRVTEALNDERRGALANMMQAYFAVQAWPDSACARRVYGSSGIDEVYLPHGAVVTVDRTASPGMIHLRGAAFGGLVGSITGLIEQIVPEDPAFSTAFIDGRYSDTTIHLLPDYLRTSVEGLLAQVAEVMEDQPHRFG